MGLAWGGAVEGSGLASKKLAALHHAVAMHPDVGHPTVATYKTTTSSLTQPIGSAMRVFPIVCVLMTLVLYVVANSYIGSFSTAPPVGAVQQAPAGMAARATAAAAKPLPIASVASETTPTPAAALGSMGSVSSSAASAAKLESTASTSLDGSLEAGLRFAVPAGRPPFLLITFGNLGVRDQLLNFATFAQRAGAAHLVGAVDQGAFDLMVSRSTAAYKTPLAQSSSYQLDGSNQHSSGSWKKFAGMRTGEVKRIVLAGYTVLHTDCDVVFLRDPTPYLMCTAEDAARGEWADGATFPCAPLREADVAVSSDNMSPDRDYKQHAAYAAGGTFNTGLLFIRPTPAGRHFVSEWHRLVVNPPRGRFAALTSDQQVTWLPRSRKIRVPRECRLPRLLSHHPPRLPPRLPSPFAGPLRASRLRCAFNRERVRPAASTHPRIHSLTTRTRARALPQVFNNMMRRPNEWPGVSARNGAWLMEGFLGMNADAGGGGGGAPKLRLGALNMALFVNGHGYFVQRAHERLRVQPLAVHATYSLDNHDALAKTQRFREAGLWAVDDDSYFGGKYLALNGSIAPTVQAAIDKYVQQGKPAGNIDVHARALTSYVAELRDALALARALGRTLVLPRWTCYCDRLWSGSDDIFHFGCMYPGAQDGKFVPFVCPMDHVLSPTAWKGQAYRDPAFLTSPRRAAAAAGGAMVDLQLLPRAAYDASPAAARARSLPLGTTDAEARRLLAGVESAPVLRLPHARGLLCGLEDAAVLTEFNALSARLLHVPQWCAKCYQPCSSELSQWLSPAELSRGVRGGGFLGGGGSFFCLNVPTPPAFRHGECVRNVADA